MKIIALPKEHISREHISRVVSQAEAIVASGNIVISPTDTVYGILGDATNAAAVQRMFALKNRPAQKALPVFVRDIAMARQYAYISDVKAKFLERIWPGPVTAVFHHKEKLPRALTDGLNSLAFRIPNDPFLAELLKRVHAPIAQTSANVSNEPPAQNIEEIKAYFEKSKIQPDLVIDQGELRGVPSTVIDCTGNEPIILRTGVISKEELDTILQERR